MLETSSVGSVAGVETSPARTVAPRRPREWWEKHYRAWRASGQSCSVFCAERGLNESSFDNWCRKFRREARMGENASSSGAKSKFVAVQLSTPSMSTGVTLSHGDVSVRFEGAVSADEIAPWVRMLRATTC